MSRVKDTLSTIFRGDGKGDTVTAGYSASALIWGSLFLCIISAALTIFNVVKGYWFMMDTTIFLVVGFAAAFIFARTGHIRISPVIMATLCAVIFTIYAITGENNGFAILWILLVPIISMLMLGIKIGFILSTYFQLFLIILFYTPLRNFVAGYYTETFLGRFPLLYLTSFGAVLFLIWQRQKLYEHIHTQAYEDALTGLQNRHAAQAAAQAVDEPDAYPNLTVLSIDINRLKWVNDNVGHEAGDELIKGAADIIKSAFSDGLCFRTGGDEFTVMSDSENIQAEIEDFHKKTAEWHGEMIGNIEMSIGSASRTEFPGMKYMDLYTIADDRMYENKTKYYEDRCIERRV